MRAGILFALAGALYAQAQPDPTQVLAHARDLVAARRASLPNYICTQTVNRSYFRRAAPPVPAPSCAQMHVDREAHPYQLDLYLTDRLRLDVKVSGGQEIGSWAGANQFDSKSIFDVVGGGPFGTGALGMFLSDIFTGGGARFAYNGEMLASGGALYGYGFYVPLGASHYLVKSGGEWRSIGYEGEVGIDPHSFELRHLLVRSDNLPLESETCETETTVDYATVRMSTGNYLLPQQSNLHLFMTDSYESDTTTSYSGCREYQSESTIKFGDYSATDAEGKTTGAPLLLPAGLPISLILDAPIDTDVAAAGDAVMEKVLKPVHAKGSNEVLIPEGATVRGRIVRMRHWPIPPARFDIAIRLESWDAEGSSSAIFAEPDREGSRTSSGRGRSIDLPEAGDTARVRTFVFTTRRERYVLPRGYETTWITVAAPAEP